LQALEEELKSTKVALSEEDNEFDKLNNLLRAKEDELNSKIAEKNAEITEIQTNLIDREKELEIIKNRSFWQKLKVCFQNCRKSLK
jgi:peptidoglycan hydrolase CwlO-like protein